MEESFRNSLIIISALIIGAIFVHGLWTIRKNKNPYRLKTSFKEVKEIKEDDLKERLSRDFDRSGFDQDGVSQVKVLGKNESLHRSDDLVSEAETPTQAAPSPEFSAEPLPCDVEEKSSLELVPEVNEESKHAAEFNLIVDDLSQETEQTSADIPSLYTDPVSKPKPRAKIKTAAYKKTTKKSIRSTIKRDQMEINFGDNTIENNDKDSSSSVAALIDPEVLAISVIVPQGQIISGAALLPSLLTLGMKYGEMNVFHRHQDNAGNGKVTFSLVNAMNPGTFDLDNMESFVTQGVSLFMTLPNASNAFEVFDQMLIAAKQLAAEFNGQLLDDKRSVLTKQTEQHYIGKIREFERKSRIASL